MKQSWTLVYALLLLAQPAMADSVTLADLAKPANTGTWRLITDQVMGGVSEGRAQITNGALHLTGQVSTKNNGGFVQARLAPVQLPISATRLRLTVRGDGQVYFVHLRTKDTRLPWQYYQAAFSAPIDWTDITLPLVDFKASGRGLPPQPKAAAVTSIALVAYGRDHQADIRLATLKAE